MNLSSTTPSSSTTTGDLVVSGGVGIGGSLSVGGSCPIFFGYSYPVVSFNAYSNGSNCIYGVSSYAHLMRLNTTN